MLVGASRHFGAVLVLSAMLGTAAVAQTDQPARGERTWTDPPARHGTTAPTAAPKPEPVTPKQSAADTASRRAAVQAPQRGSVKSTRPRVAERRRTRVADEPRTSRRVAQAARPRGRASAPYGYIVESQSGVVDFEAERLRHIRQAEAAGYLVVRSRRVEFLGGRRLRAYTPYEPDDDADE